MVYKCCVLNCKTGYASNIFQNIAVFCFPKNLDLKKWNKAMPRKSWKATNHHRLCAQHFTKDDFIDTSCDKNIF